MIRYHAKLVQIANCTTQRLCFHGNEDDIVVLPEFAKYVSIKLKNIEVHIGLTQVIILDDTSLYFM